MGADGVATSRDRNFPQPESRPMTASRIDRTPDTLARLTPSTISSSSSSSSSSSFSSSSSTMVSSFSSSSSSSSPPSPSPASPSSSSALVAVAATNATGGGSKTALVKTPTADVHLLSSSADALHHELLNRERISRARKMVRWSKACVNPGGRALESSLPIAASLTD